MGELAHLALEAHSARHRLCSLRVRSDPRQASARGLNLLLAFPGTADSSNARGPPLHCGNALPAAPAIALNGAPEIFIGQTGRSAERSSRCQPSVLSQPIEPDGRSRAEIVAHGPE